MGKADAAGWAVRIRGRYRQAETQARRAQRVAPGLLAVRERGCRTPYQHCIFSHTVLIISIAVAQQTGTRPHSARSRGPNAGLLGTKPPIGHALRGARGNYLACEPVGWPHVEAQGRRRVTTACESTNPLRGGESLSTCHPVGKGGLRVKFPRVQDRNYREKGRWPSRAKIFRFALASTTPNSRSNASPFSYDASNTFGRSRPP